MTTIELQLQAKDYAAFALYHALNSPAGAKRQVLARMNTTVACTFLSLLVVEVLSRALFAGIAMALFAGVVAWFVFPWSWQRALTSALSQMPPDDILGPPGRRRLTVDADGLVQTGEGPALSAHWDDVEHVAVTPTHVFIYVGPNVAIIVPKSVGETQIAALLATLEEYRPAAPVSPQDV